MTDPILAAVRAGEDRAERQWLLEQGQPLPDRLKPQTCRSGVHVRSLDSYGCLWCGDRDD